MGHIIILDLLLRHKQSTQGPHTGSQSSKVGSTQAWARLPIDLTIGHPPFVPVLGFMAMQGPFMVLYREGCVVMFIFGGKNGVWGWRDNAMGKSRCCTSVRAEFETPAPPKKVNMTMCLPLSTSTTSSGIIGA